MNVKTKIYRALNHAVRRSRWFNEFLFEGCSKFWEYRTFNTKVINLGSTSSCHAFNYSGIDIKGANFALPRNPLSGDEAILKNYFGFLDPKGSYVIISLCVFSSLSGGYELDDDRYYTLLFPSSIPHFSYRRQQRVKNIAANPFPYYPLWALGGELKGIIQRRKFHAKTESEMKTDAEKWMRGWMHEFSLKSLSAPLSLLNRDGITDAVGILNEIISFCSERNIKPVIVIPPMFHSLADRFNTKARRMLIYDMIEKIDDKSVPFFNYMDDKQFSDDPTLFENSFILNTKGSKLFTHRVLKDVGIIS